MADSLYLLGTFAFFALMVAYVSFCERLGQSSDTGTTATEKRT